MTAWIVTAVPETGAESFLYFLSTGIYITTTTATSATTSTATSAVKSIIKPIISYIINSIIRATHVMYLLILGCTIIYEIPEGIVNNGYSKLHYLLGYQVITGTHSVLKP